jgi:hypothetical protein
MKFAEGSGQLSLREFAGFTARTLVDEAGRGMNPVIKLSKFDLTHDSGSRLAKPALS